MNDDRPSSPHLDGPVTMPSSESGWWEVERAKWIRSRVAALSADGDGIADLGCGRGQMFVGDELANRWKVLVDSHIWDEWAPRPSTAYVCARADELPFRDNAFALVGSFDVLEHLPDDHLALSEQSRVVSDTGHVVAAVPADPRLWSAHDDAVGHLRRYRRQDLVHVAAGAHLDDVRSSYFFSFLWLPAWALRNSERRTSEPANDASVLSRAVRVVINALAGSERLLMRVVSLPFGTSVWAEFRPRRDEVAS